jgi:hypothetical protein
MESGFLHLAKLMRRLLDPFGGSGSSSLAPGWCVMQPKSVLRRCKRRYGKYCAPLWCPGKLARHGMPPRSRHLKRRYVTRMFDAGALSLPLQSRLPKASIGAKCATAEQPTAADPGDPSGSEGGVRATSGGALPWMSGDARAVTKSDANRTRGSRRPSIPNVSERKCGEQEPSFRFR